jgi:hypothetical protein
MTATYKNCQSCGMPLKKNLQGGGTEKGGTKSVKYCSRCYQEGRFTTDSVGTRIATLSVTLSAMRFALCFKLQPGAPQ